MSISRWTMISAMVVLLMGCGGDDVLPKVDLTPKERAATEQAGTNEDLCDVRNYYGDGECDEFCPLPDPDCGSVGPDPDPEPTPEPDPEPGPPSVPDPDPDPDPAPACPSGPGVDYVSEDPEICGDIFYECDEGEVGFSDPDCGCGCMPADDSCPSPDAPHVDYISQDPNVCALIDFTCPDGWDYINQSECGCGCIKSN